MNLSWLSQWLVQIDLSWLAGLAGGALGLALLKMLYDYYIVRRQERRDQRLNCLDVVDEWLDTMSKNITSMRYAVEQFVEEQRLLAQGRQQELPQIEGLFLPTDQEEVLHDARKLDDMFPKVWAATKNFPQLKGGISELRKLTTQMATTLTEPFEVYFRDLEELGDPKEATKQQVEEVAAKHRRPITDTVKAYVQALEQAREIIAATHEEILRLKQK